MLPFVRCIGSTVLLIKALFSFDCWSEVCNRGAPFLLFKEILECSSAAICPATRLTHAQLHRDLTHLMSCPECMKDCCTVVGTAIASV